MFQFACRNISDMYIIETFRVSACTGSQKTNKPLFAGGKKGPSRIRLWVRPVAALRMLLFTGTKGQGDKSDTGATGLGDKTNTGAKGYAYKGCLCFASTWGLDCPRLTAVSSSAKEETRMGVGKTHRWAGRRQFLRWLDRVPSSNALYISVPLGSCFLWSPTRASAWWSTQWSCRKGQGPSQLQQCVCGLQQQYWEDCICSQCTSLHHTDAFYLLRRFG